MRRFRLGRDSWIIIDAKHTGTRNAIACDRQAVDTASPSKLSRLASHLLSAKAALLLIASVAVVVGLRAPRWDSVVVEAIGVPEDLNKLGYSSSMVTRQLVRELTLGADANEWGRLSSFGRGINFAGGDETPEFVDKQASAIASAVLSFARTRLSKDRAIRGEIRKSGQDFELVVLGQNGSLEALVRCSIKPSAFDDTLRTCATKIFGELAPEVALLSVLAKESSECDLDEKKCAFAETKKLSARMMDDAEPANDKWAAVALALVKGREGQFNATQILKPVVERNPDFAPALLAWSAYSNELSDAQRIDILRKVVAGDHYLLGADIQLFTAVFRFIGGARMAPYPLNFCLTDDSEGIRELRQIQTRVANQPGVVARYQAKRMEGYIAMLTARNYGAQLAFESLVPEFGNDPVVLTELGDAYWYQTEIETEPAPLLKYADKALEQYQAALKFAPSFKPLKERIEAITSWRKMVVEAVQKNSLRKTKMGQCANSSASTNATLKDTIPHLTK